MRAQSPCIRSGRKKRRGRSHSSTVHGDQDKTDPSPAAARHIWGPGSGSRNAWEAVPHKTRQKSGPAKAPAEQVVKEVGRATRRQFSAEEKIRIVLEGLRGEDSIAELSVARGSSRIFITAGRRSSSRPARNGWPAIPREPQPRTRSR